jgi:ParB family chromosome partitioning protein
MKNRMKTDCLLITLLSLSALAGCQHTPQRVMAQPPPVPPARDVPIDPNLSTAARKQLADDMASSSLEVKVRAIEAARIADGREHAADILKDLSDPLPQVRFAAALAAGELRLEDARQPLLAMAEDPSENVRVAVRFALHRLGDTHLSHQLERMAHDTDPRVRSNTAMVLGMLGEPSALRILRVMRLDPKPVVRQQASEAMWRLHDESGLEDLIALSESKFPDDEMIGVLSLAEPKDTRVRQHVRNRLTADWPEVCLVAARAMGMLGSDEGYGIARQGARSTDPRQRQLAAFAYGAIGRADAQDDLRKLLSDPDQDVRLAAATAVLQLEEARARGAGSGSQEKAQTAASSQHRIP